MSRYGKNDGCIGWIVIFVIAIQIVPIIIPPVYHYIVDDILSGNCLMLLIVFAVIDSLLILFFKSGEKKRIDSYEADLRKEYSNKDYELRKEYQEKNRQLEESKKQNNIDFLITKNNLKKDYESKHRELESSISLREYDVFRREELLKKMLDGTNLFEKVPSMYADARMLILDDIANYLRTKSHPAYSAAETVQNTKRDLRDAVEQFRIMEYKYEFLLNQFPQLRYYVDDYDELQAAITDASLEDVDYDRVRDWISKDEYELLSVDERNQLALDKWINRKNKTNTQIGYEYELYVGHVYRKAGWSVEQYGIDRGLEDLGRDIIATKNDSKTGKTTIHIIQCKYWSQRKEIHENVVNQLYGTMMMYKILHDRGDLFSSMTEIKAVLVSSTSLTETATKFAKILGVVVSIQPMNDFPRIKCNINRTTGERIYHLPFDQQYYTAKISDDGEFYAWTVEEAVKAGFRRAYKYYGSNNS